MDMMIMAVTITRPLEKMKSKANWPRSFFTGELIFRIDRIFPISILSHLVAFEICGVEAPCLNGVDQRHAKVNDIGKFRPRTGKHRLKDVFLFHGLEDKLGQRGEDHQE